MSRPRPLALSDDALLDHIQRATFGYFLHETDPATGLVRDKTCPGSAASIAATGLALSAYPVAVQRGYMSRAHAVDRILLTLRFFQGSEQSTHPDATGYKGFYYHFLDMRTGRRAGACELSTVDTGFLLAGMLAAATWFTADTPAEQELRRLAHALYARADWPWSLDGGNAIVQGWTPEQGFFPYRWQGYDEGLFLYVLGLGSPKHALPADSYAGWTATYRWRSVMGQDYLHAGPLFTHQISQIWLDLRGLQDEYMRGKGIDYFENSRRATYAQREYAIRNPNGFKGYDECCWGITATDGPGPSDQTIGGTPRHFFGYEARGIPDGPDDGSIAPWATLASLPFAPEIVWPSIHYFEALRLREGNPYGFKSTFNMTAACPREQRFWVSPYHFGVDQGPVVLMIENTRSRLLWDLCRACPPMVLGLRRAGFSGGWLDAAA